jgi:hypothetical protein
MGKSSFWGGFWVKSRNPFRLLVDKLKSDCEFNCTCDSIQNQLESSSRIELGINPPFPSYTSPPSASKACFTETRCILISLVSFVSLSWVSL